MNNVDSTVGMKEAVRDKKEDAGIPGDDAQPILSQGTLDSFSRSSL